MPSSLICVVTLRSPYATVPDPDRAESNGRRSPVTPNQPSNPSHQRNSRPQKLGQSDLRRATGASERERALDRERERERTSPGEAPFAL